MDQLQRQISGRRREPQRMRRRCKANWYCWGWCLVAVLLLATLALRLMKHVGEDDEQAIKRQQFLLHQQHLHQMETLLERKRQRDEVRKAEQRERLKLVAPKWATYAASARAGELTSCPGNKTDLPDLKLVAAWQSKHDRSASNITLVTQGSADRLGLLALSCRTWKGIIAAAIYLPVVDGQVVLKGKRSVRVKDAQEEVAKLHQMVEERGTCMLDVALFIERQEDEIAASLYPVNALRNRALLLAETEAVLLLDVDFLVSRGLSDHSFYKSIAKRVQQHTAVVLPAFETAKGGKEGELVAAEAVQGGKSAAVNKYSEQELQPFLLHIHKQAQEATDYDKWQSANKMYGVDYAKEYEPYVIVAREGLPLYDERFKGYFLDKVLQLHHLAELGYKFVVHPKAFVVHVPHDPPKWKDAARKLGLRKTYFKLAEEIWKQMKSGAYRPVTLFTCQWGQPAAKDAKEKEGELVEAAQLEALTQIVDAGLRKSSEDLLDEEDAAEDRREREQQTQHSSNQ